MICVQLQVATRLPECGGVMFTFRTYLRPLKVLEERTEVMQRLLAAFLALPDDVVCNRLFRLLLMSFGPLVTPLRPPNAQQSNSLKLLEEPTEVMQRLLVAFLALPDEVVCTLPHSPLL